MRKCNSPPLQRGLLSSAFVMQNEHKLLAIKSLFSSILVTNEDERGDRDKNRHFE